MNNASFSGKRTFSYRSLTTFLLAFAFLLLFISSLVLFVLPHGRIAYWNDFRIWGMGKNQWETIHVVGGVVMFLSAFFHLYYNWNVLLSYLRRQKGALMAAILAVFLFFVGSALEAPPFSSLMDWSESIKKSWKSEPPPVPHYEYKTLIELSEEEDTDLEVIVGKLNAAGVENFTPDESLQEISARHGISPARLYELMDGKRRRKQRQGPKKIIREGNGQHHMK